MGRQVRRAHAPTIGVDQGGSDRRPELPDVARPGVRHDQGLGVSTETRRRGVVREELRREEHRIPAARAEGRQLDGVLAEAVVEILAKEPSLDPLQQIVVACADDPDVQLRRPSCAFRADPDHLPLLYRPEELRLERDRQIRHLVQEERPAVRLFEEALPSPSRPGERAGFVSEELGVGEVVGDRGAVDGDERPGTTGTLVVSGASGEFLAGPGLAAEKDRDVGRGDLEDRVPQSADRTRTSHDRTNTPSRHEQFLRASGAEEQPGL